MRFWINCRRTPGKLYSTFFPHQTQPARQTRADKPMSTAKLEQTWNELWNEWYDIVDEASQEDGQYVIEDHSWEPPYFDESAVIDDLEKIAKKYGR
jgi:hypothetical protein